MASEHLAPLSREEMLFSVLVRGFCRSIEVIQQPEGIKLSLSCFLAWITSEHVYIFVHTESIIVRVKEREHANVSQT